jgi:signal transduction histidine kinase
VAHDLVHADADPVERTVGEEGGSGREPVLRARGAALGDRYVVVCLADASGESRLRSHLGFAERLASIGELLSSVAHELNNPLTTVLGYADLLLAEADPHLPRTEIEKIRNEALRCRRIVGNLLDLARAEAVELRPMAVHLVIEKVAEFRRYACSAAGIELMVEPGEAPVVLADFHRLVQAVLNLVTNAEDAVRSAPEPRRIRVRSRAEGAKVLIEVEDTGPGVAEAVRPFIFQPFFTTKPRGKGTGLGLSLVRNTARQHGGDVRVEEAPGGGAMFVLEIPAAASV